MKVQSSVLLSKHSSFRTGGPARFFVEAQSVEGIQKIISQSRAEGLPFMILGEGSNVLISDDGFPGYVIVPKIWGIKFSDVEDVDTTNKKSDTLVIAGAGVHWDDLVAETVARNLSGLENLSWIPGSVGAAPVQNIGAYGVELKDSVEWVEVFDPKRFDSKKNSTDAEPVIRKLSREECKFGYRDSIFRGAEGKHLIITRVAFRLQKNGTPNISYKDVANFFAHSDGEGKDKIIQPTVVDVRNAIIQIRTQKLPDIKKVGTAGSFFKNPIISTADFSVLTKKFPGMPSFPVEFDGHSTDRADSKNNFVKIPLAWVLDKVCDLNGYREGNVGLYETQPLALVNFGNATTTEIKNFAQKISDTVKEKTNLEIEWEVNLM